MTELTLTREFDAAPTRVFDMVTRQENIARWWGPEGMSCSILEADFTTVGPWTSTMQNDKGEKYKVSGIVIEVDAPNSVSFTWGWHDDADVRGAESVVRFSVASNDKGGSIFTLYHVGLADDESASNHTKGWSSSLGKLMALF